MDRKVVANEVLIPEMGRLLAEGREVEFQPKGSSMLPFIRGERDSVVMLRRPTVAVGDIVLARVSSGFVMHRVFAIDGENLTLMGDGNVRGTETCRRDDVLGTVTAIIRDGQSCPPGDGRFWRTLLPIRRYLLAIIRRLPKYKNKKTI